MSAPASARVRDAARRARAAVRRLPTLMRFPEVRTDLLQVVKAALATASAWLVATAVLDLAEPFLAAWSALLVVHATVHRSMVRGAQFVVATSLGILLAAGIALSPLSGAPALAVGVVVGLLASRVPVLRLEGVAVATYAIFILVAADPTSTDTVISWLGAVVLGTGIGVAVNAVLLPPLDDRAAGRTLQGILGDLGGLLRRMAAELESGPAEDEAATDWSQVTRTLDDDLDRARQQVRWTRETQTLNPRRLISGHAGAPAVYDHLLAGLEDAVGQTRTIARVVAGGVGTSQAWDEDFRDRWLVLLDQTGRRVADLDESVTAVRDDLDRLAEDMSTQDLPGLLWPTYGSLLMALRGVLVAVDDEETVRWRAGLGEVGRPRRPFRAARTGGENQVV
ncbi:hypothetical protein KLP28_03055 [Nocardioidaceae bacterium]|nr:hypothetical protein KLP28_03055 [Nocardioidaceae bacterium]